MTTFLDPVYTCTRSHGLHMVFAAESGSRAWGFASRDSDYDIRFVFASPRDRYMAIHHPLQVMLPFTAPGDLDISGWDIRKALRLAHKSNPALLEWLGSPIIYTDPFGFKDRLLTVMAEHFSPRALAHHYVNFMANIRGKYMPAAIGEYTLKRYFYAMRPILVIIWMRQNPGQLPPVMFRDLLGSADIPSEWLPEIDTLLELKRQGQESLTHRSEILDGAIAAWFEAGHSIADDFEARDVPIEPLNKIMADLLDRLPDKV